jgi:cytochrome P450
MTDSDFPRASRLEGIRFTALVAVPNIREGLFRRRRRPVAIATRLGLDGRAVSLLAGLKRRYGDGPIWIRIAGKDALLLLGRDQIRRALEGSPDPFASDPEPKKSGMSHFQPDALTISRDPEWTDRRQFTEAVLGAALSSPELTERFAAVSRQEAAKLSGTAGWDTFNHVVRRVTRRVILGDGAASDDRLSGQLGELMEKANPPGKGAPDLYATFLAALSGYVDAAEPGSLASLFAGAPTTERTDPAGQVIHWMFALGDTLAINTWRCLALLATHDRELALVRAETEGPDAGAAGSKRLRACLLEAMRLWPTTPVLARVAARDTDWDGTDVPAGTQILIVNTFNHRDSSTHEFADRFAPQAWLDGDAGSDWSFNQLSHGPQSCPGAGLALFVGTAMLTAVLSTSRVQLLRPSLNPAKPLPSSLDHFALRFRITPRGQRS